MSTGKFFLFEALIYLLLLVVVFFSKRRLRNLENKIYSYLIIIALIELVLEIVLDFVGPLYQTTPILSYSVAKIYLIFLLLWATTLCAYIVTIALQMKRKQKLIKKVNRFFIVFFIVFALIDSALPIYFYYEGDIAYTYGSSVNLIYLATVLFCFIACVSVVWNFRNFKDKRFLPLVVFVIFGSVCSAIQYFNPGLLLATAVHVFVTFLMYFTIENPDVQMMEELYKNKKLIEKSNQDTSNFLFRMTQEIKKPVKDIIGVSAELQNYNSVDEIKEKIRYINNIGTELDYLINDALDVSSMTTKRLKIYDSRYNAINIFKEIEYRFEQQVDKKVKFNCVISNVLPSYLYGDSIKLKQAVNSILANALKHTATGEINLEVNGIIKYGVCRLIITVSDTSAGMSIEEVNNILSLNSEELSQIDLRNRDGEMLSLKEVKKLIALLGGNLMVKSDEEGTTVNIVLEQKIVESKETEISKKLESYEQSLYRNKKVMVVDDDAKELAKITTFLENHDAEVSGSLFGRDVIEKIASNIKYDLIILDDETSTFSALDVLKELKKNKKFHTPVVVMIDDNKEFIKLHYLQDGFADCIMKSKLESEVDRIMKRF